VCLVHGALGQRSKERTLRVTHKPVEVVITYDLPIGLDDLEPTVRAEVVARMEFAIGASIACYSILQGDPGPDAESQPDRLEVTIGCVDVGDDEPYDFPYKPYSYSDRAFVIVYDEASGTGCVPIWRDAFGQLQFYQ